MSLLLRRTINLLYKTSRVQKWSAAQLAIANHFHCHNRVLYDESKPPKNVIIPFNIMERKQKDTFLDVIRIYTKEQSVRYGQAEFIAYALKHMDEFGVNKDLEAYKALLDVFPKGKYIPTNRYQAMLHHFPKQQVVALELLYRMEENRVIPDYEMQQMILNIFGQRTHPIRKFWRMMYWMPKFSKLNPWPLPVPTPKDPEELAQYAVSKISSIDAQSKITHFRTKDVSDAIDNTWIVSAMSRSQQELLAVQPADKPLFIEGPFFVWIEDQCIDYFVLKGEPIKREIIYDDFNDVSEMKVPFWEKLNVNIPPTVHEQDDGVYYATCATGTSSKDSLLSWIRCLKKTNPILDKAPIVFKFKSRLQKSIEANEQTNVVPQISQDTKELENRN